MSKWQSWTETPPKRDRPVLVKATYADAPVVTYKVFFWDDKYKTWTYGCFGWGQSPCEESIPCCKPSDELLEMGGKWSELTPIEWMEIPE